MLTGTAGAPLSLAVLDQERRAVVSRLDVLTATTASTRASGGASSRKRTGQLVDVHAASPSTSIRTPSLSLRTNPDRPSSTARR